MKESDQRDLFQKYKWVKAREPTSEQYCYKILTTCDLYVDKGEYFIGIHKLYM